MYFYAGFFLLSADLAFLNRPLELLAIILPPLYIFLFSQVLIIPPAFTIIGSSALISQGFKLLSTTRSTKPSANKQ